MNELKSWIVVLSLALWAGCQNNAQTVGNESAAGSGVAATTKVVNQVVEASCGECQFGMEGSSCDLAVRIQGKTYFVDGSSIDDHGDAHGSDGLCNCIRKAKVSGEIRDGRFVATSFEIMPAEATGHSADPDGHSGG